MLNTKNVSWPSLPPHGSASLKEKAERCHYFLTKDDPAKWKITTDKAVNPESVTGEPKAISPDFPSI